LQDFFRVFHYIDDQNLPYIRGIGKGVGTKEYYWDGSKRNDHLVVCQYVLAGNGYFVSGGKKYRLEKGDFFLAEIPGKFHYYGENWSFLYLEFSPVIRQWLDLPNQVFRQCSQDFFLKLSHLIETLKADPEITLFENAQHAFSFFLDLKKEVTSLKIEKNPQALKIKSYLEKNYQQDITLEMVATHCKRSTYQIIRIFETSYHYTPMAYLRKYRILKSLALLWTDLRIVDVANAVGFNDRNYFGKVFKAEMGVTPTEYRVSKTSMNFLEG
jgi:AraC-like DNA-binding protein